MPRRNIFFHIPRTPDTSRDAGSAPGRGLEHRDGNGDSEADETIISLDFTAMRDRENGGSPVIKSYESSEGVIREFCHACGATVFWHDKWRPEVVDVGVGLLEAGMGEGPRAETWLEWWSGRVSFEEDADGRGDLVPALGRGLRAWDEGGKAGKSESEGNQGALN